MQILQQYQPIFNYTGRYLFLMGGAGTGKSFVMAQRIISDMLKYNKCYWLCTRKLHIDVGRSVFQQVKSVIDKYGLNELFKTNNSTRTICCKLNNSKVQFTGVDDPNRIKSIAEVTHVFHEEADEMDEEDFDLLDTRCRSMNTPFNQIVLAFNPPERTHWIPIR
jgi:phage terminase large subunit